MTVALQPKMSNLSDTKKSNNSEQKSSEKNSKANAMAACNNANSETGTDITRPGTGPNNGASNPTGATASPNSKTKRWGFIKSDLSEALNVWEELEKAEIALSPEEEQLVKIKSIIAQLTDKLNQF